ncbi:hypothetical protein HJG60_011194 [Phyllostomus discolor]|uniref:Uncharacterized protein n=1 Tax=Phyllostomus discolor TaxID=89673 RepID=A0A834A738_9CHIR|nr:hypothetical protein HJG60_011194 [Phyllostomus discolor]
MSHRTPAPGAGRLMRPRLLACPRPGRFADPLLLPSPFVHLGNHTARADGEWGWRVQPSFTHPYSHNRDAKNGFRGQGRPCFRGLRHVQKVHGWWPLGVPTTSLPHCLTPAPGGVSILGLRVSSCFVQLAQQWQRTKAMLSVSECQRE